MEVPSLRTSPRVGRDHETGFSVYSNERTVKSWLDANSDEGETLPESCRLRVKPLQFFLF